MKKLAGKTALVTGGGSGIGLAAARLLLEEGAHVAIAGRTAGKLDEAARALGHDVFAVPADVSDPQQVQALVEKVIGKFGHIDILVNNAGTNIKERKFQELTPESWRKMVQANLDSAFYCSRAVLPGMVERKDGLIINIGSISGLRASPLGGVAYAAAKFGVTALGIGLGAEEKDNGIRVSNIYPGEVDTPLLEFRPQPVTEEHRQRILRPDDVAAAIVFIAMQPAHVSIPELVIKPTWQAFW